MDVADALDEKRDKELQRLIERRSESKPDPDEREELWQASVRRYHAKRQGDLAVLWHAYHVEQAQRARETLSALIERHESAARKLSSQLEKGQV